MRHHAKLQHSRCTPLHSTPHHARGPPPHPAPQCRPPEAAHGRDLCQGRHGCGRPGEERCELGPHQGGFRAHRGVHFPFCWGVARRWHAAASRLAGARGGVHSGGVLCRLENGGGVVVSYSRDQQLGTGSGSQPLVVEVCPYGPSLGLSSCLGHGRFFGVGGLRGDVASMWFCGTHVPPPLA